MRNGQKTKYWGLHGATQLKETFQFLLDDFDTICDIVYNNPRTSHFRSLGTAINIRLWILRNYYPNESGVFISLYQALYESWKGANEMSNII